MEYVQLSMDEYIQSKNDIKNNLGGIVKSFVRIGWQLTRIDRSGAYKNDGYSSIAEFAAAEYGMNRTGVSRFMNVYETYSADGDTPELKEQYREFKFSQLTELLQVQEADRQMFTPEVKREDIREFQRFEKENEADPARLLDWKDAKSPEEKLKATIQEFCRENKDILNAVYSSITEPKDLAEMISPSGSRSYRKGTVYLMFYEETKGIMVKVFGETPVDITYRYFLDVVHSLFDEYDAGAHTWEKCFGVLPDEGTTAQKQEEPVEPKMPEHSGKNIGNVHEDISAEKVMEKPEIAPAQQEEQIALTTSWKKFSFVKDVTSVEETGSLIMFGGGNTISTGNGNIYIYRPDVRHGYTSEDVFNLLTNNGKIEGMYMTGGKLYWNGAYIKSKSITTAALAADSVTAEKIKVDDLYSLKASIAGFKIASDTISHQSVTNPASGIGQTYYDTYFSSRDKRLTFRKGPGTSDYMTFSVKGLRTSNWKCLDLISDADTNDEDITSGNHHSLGFTNIYGALYVAGGLKVAGTKQAVRETENYGEKGVYCYETPTPLFGDVGSGEIAADEKCYVDIEDILKEMINTEIQYYVFLQKRGEGDLYVSECTADYFVVTGTPGLKFFWEIKVKQKDYEYYRYEGEDRNAGFKMIKYDDNYISEIEQLIEEREEA